MADYELVLNYDGGNQQRLAKLGGLRIEWIADGLKLAS